MQWVLNAIIRYKNFLLFLFLFSVGLIFSEVKAPTITANLQKAV